MTTKHLIEILQQIQNKYGDVPVICMSDSEGNTLSDLFRVQVGELDLANDNYYDNSITNDGTTCVFLQPRI